MRNLDTIARKPVGQSDGGQFDVGASHPEPAGTLRRPAPASDRQAFSSDMAKMNAEFERLGAVKTYPDGWRGIDPAKVPADLADTYARLTSYGYANGLLGDEENAPQDAEFDPHCSPTIATHTTAPKPEHGTIRIAYGSRDGVHYGETDALLIGGFGVHKTEDGRRWVATHAASGTQATHSYFGSRRIDAVRMAKTMTKLAEKVPGYWQQERPAGQHLIGQLPTTPERKAHYGSADGMIFAHDIAGIARDLVYSKDADPKYQAAQAKFHAVTGADWKP